MRLILPKNPNFKGNKGEEYVYRVIEKSMPEGTVTYYNYHIDGKNFDFCMVIKNRGVLLIEVKSWDKNYVVDVEDENSIILKDRIDRSPFAQARNYVEILWKISRDKIGEDIPILPIACFTNIDKVDYFNLELDKVCNERLTIFKSDLGNETFFTDKISSFFKYADQYNKNKSFYNFTNTRYFKFRSIFETNKTLRLGKSETRKIRNREKYSVLKIDKAIDQDYIDSILDLWSSGTIIYIVTSDKNSFKIVTEKVENKIKELKLGNTFKPIKNKLESYITFNFNLYFTEIELQPLEIIDGERLRIDNSYKQLKEIDKNSYFNLGQYEVEHDIKGHISVKAGAGTGKTHTMISRVMFLIYHKGYSSQDLKEKIILITFTREAADNMKDKLKEKFINYFKLTRDVEYISHIDAVTNMNISTIHALVLKVIQSYGHILGYGNEVSIGKGTMERRMEIDRTINNLILKDGIKMDGDTDLTYYRLKAFIIRLLGKIEDRNIDILKDTVDLGAVLVNHSEAKELDETIKKSLIESEKNVRKRMKRNNKIQMSQVIIEFEKIVRAVTESGVISESKIDYLFIDEFQDTDDAQIDLLKMISQYMDFKLFIVGDVKQCIYRFRGAEEEAFERLISSYNPGLWEHYTLNKNYRTNKLLLNKYDEVFTVIAEQGLLAYDQERDFLKSGTGIQQENDIDIINGDGNFEEMFLETIKNCYDELAKKSKSKKSIGIIVRHNKQVKKIIDIGNKNFGKLGFVIENPSVGNLYGVESTIDFYKLVTALLYNKNPKYLINLYTTNYLSRDFDFQRIYQVREDIEGNGTGIYDEIMHGWPIKNWEKYLDSLRNETTLMVLREIIYELKPWNNYNEKFQSEETTNKNTDYHINYYKNNLDLLFEKLINSFQTDYLTLPKLEESLRILITTGAQEETRVSSDSTTRDNVRVICTNVHKAKGLEYDYVVLPYMDLEIVKAKLGGDIIIENHSNKYIVGYSISKNIKNSNYSRLRKEESSSQEKEEMRILYVALTRAKEKLVLFKYQEMSEETWQGRLEELYREDGEV